MVAYPVIVNKRILEAAKRAGIKLERKIGLLAMWSSSSEVFTTDNIMVHKTMLSPFVKRIEFEFVRQALKLHGPM